ncbi:MAG: AAA family ATPase [Anaerolineae bacterium]|nr:AAA family ATPase [Anaerolineae bacterium]
MTGDIPFGEWLRRRRRGLDLTQQELARQAGCTVSTLRKIEAGERRPSKVLAAQLAAHLNIAPEEYERFIVFARTEFYPDLSVSPPAAVRSPAVSSAPVATTSPPSFLAPETDLDKPPPVFVTRERELAELETALAAARSGQGQILFVIGGAGRGKTTLVHEFIRRAQAADPELVVVSGYCNAHTGLGDPYLPFREALNMLMGDVETKWAAGLITSEHARRLWELMSLTVPALVKQSPDLIGSLVLAEPLLERAATFAPPDVPWVQQLRTLITPAPSPGLQQKQILTQYTALLKTVAAQYALLLILEDLHWVDTASNALLFHLCREVGNDRILIIGSYRPDEVALSRGEVRHPLAGVMGELKRQHGDIWLDLGELASAEEQQFVEAYVDTQPNRLGRMFREALFRQTKGQALFTVELLREMQERGDLRQDAAGYWVEGAAIDWAKLPVRVEGVIEQRISRLTADQQAILTVASVEGETFTAEAVARIQQLNERDLVQQLSRELDKQHRLVTAQALDRVGQQRLSFYRFRHHLFQHYLYQNLDELERAYLHEAVGLALETLYGEQTEPVAVQLARHFEQAGLTEQAVDYLRQSGYKALRQSANVEAINHLTRGLELLKTLPATAKRAHKELELLLALAIPLRASKGFSASELEETYSRALAICRQLGETPELAQVLVGLARIYAVRAENATSYELAEQAVRIAEQVRGPGPLSWAHFSIVMVLLSKGEPARAYTHVEQGLLWCDPKLQPDQISQYGLELKPQILNFGAVAQWILGFPERALRMVGEALALAEELSHPLTLAATLHDGFCLIHVLRREAQRVEKQAETLITLSTEYGFPYYLGWGTVCKGWALASRGETTEGIRLLRQGISSLQAIDVRMMSSLYLALLAEAHWVAGESQAGLEVVTEALAEVARPGDCVFEAELYRLKGALLLKAEATAEAEACFRQAIEVARQQEAKSLELRATVSLTRLWQSQGKGVEARPLLAELYDRFTEGFDTVDLREAKTLLAALS